MPIKTAVVGVGYLGKHHARIYSELPKAELVSVVDVNQKTAEGIAEKCGCKAYTDFRDALEKVQALSIVTPTSSHYEIALACLKEGKDLLIEKPMTATVKEADRLINEADKRGCLLQVGHLERYNPALVAAQGLIKKPVFFESERVSPFPGRGTDVDITLDLMIHDIDILLSILGTPVLKKLNVVGSSIVTDKIDVAKAWLEFEGGPSALITASRISQATSRRLKVFEKDSYMVIDYQRREVKRFFRGPAHGISVETVPVETKEPLREELVDFLGCVSKRRKPKVTGVEARDALKIALRVTEKIRGAQ